MDMHTERVEKVRAALKKKNLDCALFFSGESTNDLPSENTYYLSGFLDAWHHAVLVTKTDAILFTGELSRAEKECRIDATDIRKKKIHAYLREKRIRKIGIDPGFSFAKWNALRGKIKSPAFKDITQEMLKIRGIKDKEELSKIKAAAGITKKALNAAENNVHLGDEGALMQKVKTEFINWGAEPAFPPIVAGDENSSNIHYFGCNKKYKSILMTDIGARKEWYNSDFTRTYVLEKNHEMLRAHETLERLCGELSDFVAIGTRGADACSYAKKFLEKEGYKNESFTNYHSLGHGVGLGVHEWPPLTMKGSLRNTRLLENMVFTLEPALYFKDKFGARIENMFVLTKSGLKEI